MSNTHELLLSIWFADGELNGAESGKCLDEEEQKKKLKCDSQKAVFGKEQRV